MSRKAASMLVVASLLLGASCGNSSGQREWCARNSDVVAWVSAAYNPDQSDWDTGWTHNIEILWGEATAEQVAELIAVEDPAERYPMIADVLRIADADLFDKACDLAFGTVGSLTHEQAVWCDENEDRVKFVAGNLNLRVDDVRFIGERVEACRTAFETRTG